MIIIKYFIKLVTYFLYKIILEKTIKNQKKIRNNKKILIQINSGIGDSILALPLIYMLNEKGYEIHVIANKYTKVIAKLCPEVKKYYVVDYKNIWKMFYFIRNMNKLKFKYFIGTLPSNLIRDAFLPIILRIPIRIKHVSPHKEKYRNYDFIFNKLMKINQTENNVVSNLMLYSLINKDFCLDTEKVQLKISLPHQLGVDVEEKMRKMGYDRNKVTLGIHPGCKTTWAFKRWPAENFAEVIDLLIKQDDLQIILFGGPDETDLAKRITQKTTTNPIDLIGKLSLEETICAVSLCHMFTSNDSGLMHVATLFSIPVVGLFSHNSNEILTGPYGMHHIIIKKHDIDKINIQEVYKKIKLLLDTVVNN